MFPRTLGFMILCASIGYLLGRFRGMGLQGLFFGLAFGPLGWGLILLWPRTWVQGPMPRDAGHGAFRSGGPGCFRARPGPKSPPETGSSGESHASGGCPRCGRSVEPGAGACGHCGNVLVPIHYAVDPDDK